MKKNNLLSYDFVDRHEVFGRAAALLLLVALGVVIFLFWGIPLITSR